jgi:carbonic anhydrase
MRSILVAVYALGAEHIFVVGHHDCGMTGLNWSRIVSHARQRGVPASTFTTLSSSGVDLRTWLSGFDTVQSSVRHSVQVIKQHPLLQCQAAPISVHGFVICPTTGQLELVAGGEQSTQDNIGNTMEQLVEPQQTLAFTPEGQDHE